jgi:acetate kinase
MPDEPILVINSGSSSLKFGLYAQRDGEEQAVLDGLADGIGRATGKLELKDAQGRTLRSGRMRFASEDDALEHAARWLAELSQTKPVAVGHRVVHGGPHLLTHQLVTPALLKELEKCVHFAPLHIPTALRLIKSAERSYPKLPQFACFDTAFHTTIPEVAARFALPRPLFDEGIRRYGFHGLSYESIVHQLGKDLPSRAVMAHLGNGASLAAVQDGRSVDTTMGLTPTGGIPMATRSGDLDPGVLLYLLAQGYSAEKLEDLLNHRSGLLGVSGRSSDMKVLLENRQNDPAADLAVKMFCYQIKKFIGAYAAVLGGLDTLVFTGGIGERAVPVRAEICRGLEHLGIALDLDANARGAAIVSRPDASCTVRVIATDEDLMIARHTQRLLVDG